ncbi:MAG: aminopeptidase [Pseudomonadota bacterium]
MQSNKLTTIVILLLSLPLSGCYYLQAAGGHLEVMNKREPIDALLDDPTTPEDLARRLRLVTEARDFSIATLALPDNDSYRSYTDLERDFVLWNIFAAPEYDLAPKTWCYPIVGCLGYRGYFDEERARGRAERLQAQGYDVAVGGVVAYSTLGKFSDPVVNTMMGWDDLRLVALLFHELAHQVIYVPDDTMFNESFATAVEELGLELWLEQQGQPEQIARYQQRKALQQTIIDLVSVARDDLARVYAFEDSAAQDVGKRERFAQLSADVSAVLEQQGLPPRHWLIGDIGNAHLVPIALYETWVPAFRQVYKNCEQSFDCLYAETKRLGGLPAEARHAALQALN